MARRLWSNNARCRLGADIVTTGTLASITLETGKGSLFPSPSGGDWFVLSVEDSSKNVECFKITSRSGDICAVGSSGTDRAQEGTTARTFTAATSVAGIRPTKGAFEAVDDHKENATAAHAATAISTTGAYATVQAFLTALAASVAALAGVLTAPAGTRMVFQNTAAPTGWTKDTTHNDKSMRVVSGTVTSGGATAFTSVFGSGKNTGSYVLQIADIPVHSHGVTDPGHTHGTNANDYSGVGASAFGSGANLPEATIDPATTGITIQNAGGGGGHVHTLSLDLQYLDFIVAQKD